MRGYVRARSLLLQLAGKRERPEIGALGEIEPRAGECADTSDFLRVPRAHDPRDDVAVGHTERGKTKFVAGRQWGGQIIS